MVSAIRIAMWSGPRSLSTAMMRAWENRPDCEVWDEPLYPWWLKETGADHPGRDHILSHSTDQLDLMDLCGRLSSGMSAPITFQKHMSHHVLPSCPRDWMHDVRHAFLIRRPDRVLASLSKQLPAATTNDTGLPQQVELLHWLVEHDAPSIPIIDCDDILSAPENMLRALCDALGVTFSPAMLSWPAGPRASDGIWADWWYERVRSSTGFGGVPSDVPVVPQAQQACLDQCWSLYDEMASLKITC